MAGINADVGERYHPGYVVGTIALTAALAGAGCYSWLNGVAAAHDLIAGAAVGLIVALDAIADCRGD